MANNLQFPKNFFWGAATSAHQVEGNNENDWTQWENENAKRLATEAKDTYEPWQQEQFPEMFDPQNYISGQAADHYNRYEKDFDIAKELGHNAHRISLEWSRIEPKEGEFDEDAIQHYKDVIQALRARGMEPFVTLWHWTNPVWLDVYGGWEKKEVAEKFLRYAERIVNELTPEVTFWMIFNEPNVFVGRGYIQCDRPPMKKSYMRAFSASRNLFSAHKKTYDIIHRRNPKAEVVLSHFAVYMEPYKNKFRNKLVIPLLDYIRNWRFFEKLNGYFDRIGIQYYRIEHINVCGWGGMWGPVERLNIGQRHSDMGWIVEPKGIENVLKRAYKYKKPIFITENGIADASDALRTSFIKEHIAYIHKAIEGGIDIRGYLHWSFLDNFEWEQGFWPRFGLVEVDYKTQKRTIRPSAYEYAKICRSNILEVEE